jgi:prepilin-type processing-associated H-X9-DG protein
MGQVCYRHLGNADMVFFDGHAASLKADEVYDKDNPVLSAGNVKNRRPNLLWDVGSTSDLTGSKK